MLDKFEDLLKKSRVSSRNASIVSDKPDLVFPCKNHANKKIKYFDREGKTFCCSLCIFEYEISKKTSQACSDDDIVKQGEVLAENLKKMQEKIQESIEECEEIAAK